MKKKYDKSIFIMLSRNQYFCSGKSIYLIMITIKKSSDNCLLAVLFLKHNFTRRKRGKSHSISSILTLILYLVFAFSKIYACHWELGKNGRFIRCLMVKKRKL